MVVAAANVINLVMLKSLPLFLAAGVLVAAEPSKISDKYSDPAQKLIAAARG